MSTIALPSAEGATRLVLIRHGEVEEHARHRCYGRLDVALSPEGHEQAARTAAWLCSSRSKIDALWSSPLKRAVDSARPVAAALGLAPQLHEDLREIDCGDLEGLTFDEIRESHPEVYAEWRARLAQTKFPGGESYFELHARVTRAAAEIRAAHAGQTVVVVAHGGVNRALLADALGVGAAALFRIDQAYAAVSVIDYYSEVAVVRLMNATP